MLTLPVKRDVAGSNPAATLLSSVVEHLTVSPDSSDLLR